jgi:hypothetical protein
MAVSNGAFGGSIAIAPISGEVTIDAPVEKMSDLLADKRKWAEVQPANRSFRNLSEGPVGMGHAS